MQDNPKSTLTHGQHGVRIATTDNKQGTGMTDYFDDDLNHDEFDDEEIKSRSEIKREVQALQTLGASLCKLSKVQLDSMDLPDNLRSAIADYQRFTSRTAMKRQLQYIGKVMRHIDPEPIKQTRDRLLNQDCQLNAHFHRLEKWRDRLLNEGDEALTELINSTPDIDKQQLRQMIRNAQREASKNRPPKSARAIFQYLKEKLRNEGK